MKNYSDQYSLDYKNIKAKIQQEVSTSMDEFDLKRYHFTVANFKNFYPEIFENKSPEEVFSELLYTRYLAPFDAEKYVDRVRDIQVKGNLKDVTDPNNGPFIFCAYHVGSYRAIIGTLAKLGYDFSLIIDQQVYDSQGEMVRQNVRNVNKQFGTKSDFDLINAEDFQSAMKMVKHLKMGKSLVIYIDGNTGTGGVFRHDEKLEKIQFFNRSIFARQGIAYISFLTNTPIVPAICYRDGLNEKDNDKVKNIVLEFYDSILPEKGEKRKHFTKSCTQLLYKHLEDKIKEFPFQWEGWLYLHKYLDEERLREENLSTRKINTATVEKLQELKFNEDRYGLFKLGQYYFIFDGLTYKTFPLEKAQFEFFKGFLNTTEKKDKDTTAFEKTEILELLEADFLVPGA